MISHTQVERARYTIDASDVVDLLIAGYRTDSRGRPPNRAGLRLMLIGLYLSVSEHGKATLTNAYKVLTEELGLDEQLRLGVAEIVDGVLVPNVELQDFYNLVETIKTRLAYTEQSAPELDDDERRRRHEVVQDYCDALMDLAQVPIPTGTVAIDATGVWSWGRGPRKPKAADVISDPELLADAVIESAASEDPAVDVAGEPDGGGRRGKRRDVDAAWGVKTRKDGKVEVFFGYHEHTVVQVADIGDEGDDVPSLITRFELTAASVDVVDVTLGLIDRNPFEIRDAIVDRHYSHKDADRWKSPLAERGVNQHLDLRQDEHGFTEAHRMRWAAGEAFCPATPDDLGTIERPGTGASAMAFERFEQSISRRSSYAMRRVTRPDAEGTYRVQCPAVAGKVGCPLRAGTEAAAIELGLPLIEQAPDAARDGEALPTCCTQQTVKVTPPKRVFKLQQPYTWGSEKWTRIWKRRTYVEGTYGNRKNPSTENLRRGQTQVFGLVWMHIVLGLVNASYNQRTLERWAQRHPDHPVADHPLVKQLGCSTIGPLALTADEYRAVIAMRDRTGNAAA